MAKSDNWINSGWCETWQGHKFYFADHLLPHNVYDVRDIAHALARSTRYNGHIDGEDYSVGEHVCTLAQHVYENAKGPAPREEGQSSYWPDPWERAVAAYQLLHHDDPEYILSDLVSPLKKEMPEYKRKERLVERQIARKFNLEYPHPPYVKEFDRRILIDERQQILRKSANIWDNDGQRGLGVKLDGLRPNDAEEWFLDIHAFLVKKIAA